MKSVKIILNEDVYNLGEEGDVCTVAPGYARNYLIPKGYAVAYNRRNVAIFEERKATIEKRKNEKRDAALSDKERIENLRLDFEMPAGSSGKLFGSVTNQNIAERLMQEGINIERKKIEVPGHTIKMTGEYSVTIKLYADESAELPVVVRAEGSEPETGKDEEKQESKEEPVPTPLTAESDADTADEAQAESDQVDTDAESLDTENEEIGESEDREAAGDSTEKVE